MVLAAGMGTRMRPLTDTIPKPLVPLRGRPLIDHVLDRIAEAGIANAVVNVHHHADKLEAHLAGRKRPKITISDERGVLLDTGGGLVKALPKLGPCPFLIHNSNSVWIEGIGSNLARLMAALGIPSRMDSLMLLAIGATSLGYEGHGDFNMTPDGAHHAARRASRGAVRLHRCLDRPSAPVRGRAAGTLLAQPALGPRHRARPPLRHAARRHVDARRHA